MKFRPWVDSSGNVAFTLETETDADQVLLATLVGQARSAGRRVCIHSHCLAAGRTSVSFGTYGLEPDERTVQDLRVELLRAQNSARSAEEELERLKRTVRDFLENLA